MGEKLGLYDKVSRDGCFSLKVNKVLSPFRILIVDLETTGRDAYHGLRQEELRGVL